MIDNNVVVGATVLRTRVERLCDYLWINQRREFAFGIHDCGLFTVRWIDRELGTGYERCMREHVHRAGLTRTLAHLRNAGAYRELVTLLTGGVQPSAEPPHPGDVAVFVSDTHLESLGLMSTRLVHAPGAEGVVSFDASRVLCHWSLECLKR